MITREIIVHYHGAKISRISTMLFQKAYEFTSRIWIQKEEARVNARSLLSVLALDIKNGTKISIIAEGEDEQAAVNSLVYLAEYCFA